MSDKRKTKGLPVVVWIDHTMKDKIDRAARGNRSYWIRSAIEDKLDRKTK